MYQILINGGTKVQGDGRLVIEPTLTEAVNTAGTLKYSVTYQDPEYDEYEEKVTTVEVRNDQNETEWAGRLLYATETFYGEKELEFEGDMALLKNIQYPPYDYTGAIGSMFSAVMSRYNARCSATHKIYAGNVTVTGNVTVNNEEYSSCWTVLSDQLVKNYGGYLVLRYEDGKRYLDYLKVPGKHSKQQIRFGENLLSLECYVDASSVATVLIPQGARPESTDDTTPARIGIATAAKNTSKLDYIVTSLVDTYGWIEQCQIWDDITDVNELYAEAQEYAEEMVFASMQIKVSVVDLHIADASVEPFCVGDTIDAISVPHKLATTMMMTERTRDLNDPESDTVTLGSTSGTLTSSMSKAQAKNALNLKEITAAVAAEKNRASTAEKGLQDQFDSMGVAEETSF